MSSGASPRCSSGARNAFNDAISGRDLLYAVHNGAGVFDSAGNLVIVEAASFNRDVHAHGFDVDVAHSDVERLHALAALNGLGDLKD